MRNLFLLVLLLFSSACFSQIRLTGHVYDSLNKPIAEVSITVIHKASNLVISHTWTDKNGLYNIFIRDVSLKDSIRLRAMSLGYAVQEINVTNNSERINFKLAYQSVKLPPVTVKNNDLSIKHTGDTLTYNVSSYTSPQDRVIGDIIKKLPGVEMDDNGKIKYQGKEINRLYIDGENLLDGRYNAATTTIGVDQVDKVQILENHQPIKALRDLQISNDPALNIALKEKARLRVNTNGDLAVGTPSLHQGSLNSTLFRSKLKFINYGKWNNTGHDLSIENISHFTGINEYFNNDLLKITAPNPNLPIAKRNYLFNNAVLININSLLKLKNENVVRLNGSLLTDHQFQEIKTSAQFFLPSDTIKFYEYKNSRPQIRKYDIQFNYTKNTSAYYLNNTLSIVKIVKTTNGYLESSSNKPIIQQLQSHTAELMHELNYMKPISSQWTIAIYSAFLSRSSPESLQIIPGLFENQLNQGNSFSMLKQQVTLPTLYLQQSLVFRKKGKFTQNYKISLISEKQQLQSQLLLTQNTGIEQIAKDPYTNNLHWRKSTGSVESALYYSLNKVRLSLTVPIEMTVLTYSNKGNLTPFKTILSSPQANIHWRTGKATNVSTSVQTVNELGNIEDVYAGYIMTTYRTLQSGNNFVPKTNQNKVTLRLEKKNPIKSVFINLDATHAFIRRNYLSTNQVNESFQESLKTEFSNTLTTQNIGLNISKYLFKLKANWTNRLSVIHSTTNAINNGAFAKIKNKALSLESALQFRFNTTTNMTYSGKLTMGTLSNTGRTVLDKKQTKTSKIAHHSIIIDSKISKYLSIKTSNNYFVTKVSSSNPTHIILLDVIAVFKFSSFKADIECSLSNLLGVGQLTAITIAENMLSETNYTIRPRMMLVKFNFHF